MAYPLSSTRQTTGRRSAEMVLRNSQNSPSPVAPSPIDTYVTSSSCTTGEPGRAPPNAGSRLVASAQPAACRHCVPVALDPFTMCSDGLLQWERSEEHTSELQSLTNLVCRLLLEKKKTRPSRRPLG